MGDPAPPPSTYSDAQLTRQAGPSRLWPFTRPLEVLQEEDP